MYVIRILNSKDDCWITEGSGDPPRTLCFKSAQRFKKKKHAGKRIDEVKETHPYKRINYDIQKH